MKNINFQNWKKNLYVEVAKWQKLLKISNLLLLKFILNYQLTPWVNFIYIECPMLLNLKTETADIESKVVSSRARAYNLEFEFDRA